MSCDTKDNAGNTASTTTTYIVGKNPNVGSSTVSINSWTNTYVVDDMQFKEGFTRMIKANQRMRIFVEGLTHHVGVKEVTDTTAKIEVSSDPQIEILNIGETKLFDVSGDAISDLSVTLNSLDNKNANITVISIQKEIVSDASLEEPEQENGDEILPEETGKTNFWKGLIIVLVIIAIVFTLKKYGKIFN